MRPRAAAIAEASLQALVCDVWAIPAPHAKRLRHALRSAPCARAQVLRQQLALVGITDLDAAFRGVITPAFLMALLNDLGAVGALTLGDIHLIEDCILRCVDKDGDWLSYHTYKERNVS
jgi:hypothetical protein